MHQRNCDAATMEEGHIERNGDEGKGDNDSGEKSLGSKDVNTDIRVAAGNSGQMVISMST